MKKHILIISVLFIGLFNSYGQNKESYNYAFNEIIKMLDGEKQLDFKKAVFLTENAFYSDQLSYNDFCQQIDDIEAQLNKFINDRQIASNKLAKQFAIFSYMMEPSIYNNNKKLIYNFDDITGQKDWTVMFVTKLLNTGMGNCHSLPYLYKILADEMGAEAYIALAPNHMYIKHKDDKGMWVNVELTNGTFSRDAWIIASLSITSDAIKYGTYMEALTQKQTVALCLYDLALGYQFQFGYDDFGITCCDSLAAHYPTCIYAYMVKADILLKKREAILLANNNERTEEVTEIENSVAGLYARIDSMGYKDMPKEQYEQWVKDAENERLKQQQK